MTGSETFQRINVQETKQKLDAGWKPFVYDCRRPEEWEISKFDFTNLFHPHDQIEEIIEKFPKDTDILIHCRTGGRSGNACEVLAAKGFKNCFNLEGGINGWAKEIDPSLKTY